MANAITITMWLWPSWSFISPSLCKSFVPVVPHPLTNYSSRFAMRTARTQEIWRRGKKRAYLAQPKADWVKLGRPWPEVGPNRSPLGPKLGVKLAPNWSPTGVQHGAAWARLDASWAHAQLGPVRASGLEVGPNTSPTWATWLRTKPHQSQKTLEKAVKMQVFSVSHWVRKIGSGWTVGPNLASGAPPVPNLGPSCAVLDPTGTQVGANWS